MIFSSEIWGGRAEQKLLWSNNCQVIRTKIYTLTNFAMLIHLLLHVQISLVAIFVVVIITILNVTESGKTAHFAQKLIFQYKRF